MSLSPVQIKAIKRRICLQTQPICHHLVRDREYLFGGDRRGAVLFYENPAQPGARYRQGKAESAAHLYDPRVHRHRLCRPRRAAAGAIPPRPRQTDTLRKMEIIIGGIRGKDVIVMSTPPCICSVVPHARQKFAFLPALSERKDPHRMKAVRGCLMPPSGFEPLRLAAQDSKSCVSANFTTAARISSYHSRAEKASAYALCVTGFAAGCYCTSGSAARRSFPQKKRATVPGPTCEPVHRS